MKKLCTDFIVIEVKVTGPRRALRDPPSNAGFIILGPWTEAVPQGSPASQWTAINASKNQYSGMQLHARTCGALIIPQDLQFGHLLRCDLESYHPLNSPSRLVLLS